jgi:hypothetical protein
VRVEVTYFDEEVIMWGRHDAISRLKKKEKEIKGRK